MADGTVGRLGQTDDVIRGDDGPRSKSVPLAPTRPPQERSVRGTMLWFNAAKDLGALRTDDGKRMDVLGTAFLRGEKPAGRCAGELVSSRPCTARSDTSHSSRARRESEARLRSHRFSRR